MKRYLFILVLFLACSSNDVKPDNVVSQKVMIQILADIHMSDAAIELKRFDNTDKVYEYKLAYMNSILEHHQIDQDAFDTSYDYYSKDLLEFSFLYDSVMVEMSKRSALQ